MTNVARIDCSVTDVSVSPFKMRRAAAAGGYRREWFGGDADVPGLSSGLWMGDLTSDSRQWSFPKNAAPVSGDKVLDVFEGTIGTTGYGRGDIVASETAVFDYDEGIQLSTYTAIQRAGVTAPAALSAAIWDNDDYFLAWLYVTLPTADRWPTFPGTTPAIMTMQGTNSADPSAFAIRMVNADGAAGLWFQRQIGAASTITAGMAAADIPFGETALLAIYRDANGAYAYRRSAGLGEKIQALPSNEPNGLDYSGQQAVIGIGGANQGNPSHVASSTSNDLRWHKIVGFGIEVLGLTGRDPLAILRGDWGVQRQRAERCAAGPLA